MIFVKKTFTDCCQRTPRPQISRRRLLQIATKPQNLREFSPSKVSGCTDLGRHWHIRIYLAKFMEKTIHSLCIPEELFRTASNKQGYLYLLFLYVTSDLRSGNKARLVGGESQVSFLLWVWHNWKVPELKGNILHVFLNQPLNCACSMLNVHSICTPLVQGRRQQPKNGET